MARTSAADGVRSSIDRQDIGGPRTVPMDTDSSLHNDLRKVLIEGYDSVAENWALLPGMS
ncbi:hypothetical protein QFZ49_003166 [Streptomyces turgidiscabies]|uniref:Uncharacterized protein n=1 Tax=Streptomyces turgidiscabies TaxID=85558 RepID=A0ABU0RMN6_9ACTN|nr:hypothetical protein [Streptomyces turgidiscabies]